MDVARYGDFTTLRYTNAKVRENYTRRFSIRFPNEELPAARPQQTTPLYDIMVRDNNAVMGDSWGLETPLWFAPAGSKAEDELSFHRSNDFEHVGNEVRGVRERVGVTEIANFAKYEVSGKDAGSWLDQLMTNKMPRPGRIVLSPMLNHKGKLIGDFTIANAGQNRFMMWGSSAAQIYHTRWFEQHLQNAGDVRVHRFGQTLVGLAIAGPRSRELLQRICDVDITAEQLRFMDYRETDVAACPCRVNRISYTGDLGYEIWMEPTYERTVYLGLKRAGADLGCVDFGMRALLSMRLEKNFPTWFAELRPIYGPFEADMGRFVKLDKGEFIGRDAAQAEFETGPALTRVTLIVDTENTDVMGDEPIWAKIGDVSFDSVSAPQDFGAHRFDQNGTQVSISDSQRDGDWAVVGWVTSGGYGHSVKMSLAQGYIPTQLAEQSGTTEFAIEILGQRYAAKVQPEPAFDPSGKRMRG